MKEEINFADDISYYDYEREKDNFFKKNKARDAYLDFSETKEIPGMKHHNLIKLVEKEPFIINYLFFFISTILTVAEFFRMYIESFCVEQEFTVRKLISTRYNLNKPEYQELVPKINLNSIEYIYKQNDYNYLNKSYNLQLPTKEELEEAKKYQNRVPYYKISSRGEIINDDHEIFKL